MTKLKKVVALVLSVLLAFGSMSVMAAAWDAYVDDGFTTTIKIKPYRYDAAKDEWVETTKAKPGEKIQIRVFLGTDYYTSTGSFFWGWSKDFFDDTLTDATTNFTTAHFNQSATSDAKVYGITGDFTPYRSGYAIVSDEELFGHIDTAWEEEYNWTGMTFINSDTAKDNGTAMMSTDEYLVKFDNYFTVKSLEDLGDVTEGTFDIPVGSFDNWDYSDPAYGNLSKCELGDYFSATDMFEWRDPADETTLDFEFGSISVKSDVTFDANGGKINGAATYDLNGIVGNTSDVSAVPAPTAPAGQVFVGWYDASIENPDPETDVFSTGTVTHDYSDDNIDYKAYYKAADPDSVTLTFLMGEEEGAATHATLTGAPHDPLTAPAAPEKAGYTFAGWSPEVPAEYPTSNVTYIAQWTANSNTAYTVKTWEMDVNGAYPTSSDQGFTGTTGTTATVTAPEKIGFAFDAEASNLSGTITGDGNLVLNLYYKRNQYTVTTLDGSAGNATISTGTYYYDQDVTFTAPPKEGYSVSGWTYFNADNFSILATAPAKMPAHNITAIVNYAANTYKVQFYGFNNADLGFQMIEYGKAATAPSAPTVTGYTFKEWDTDFSSVKSELTVKAIYEANTYKVAYYDGENLIEEIDVAYDATTVGKPAEDPTKDGYTFAGWTYQDAEGNAITDLSLRPAADFVAKANWDAIEYELTFVVDGATYHTIKADYDTAIDTSTLKQPTKEGYTFGGWSPAIPEKMPLNGATITATWNVNPYTITYVVDGETYTTQTYDFGKDVTAPEAPKKDGYTFGSWTYTYVVDGATVTLDSAPATMPAHNLTATGSWVVGSANVVINIYTEDLGADTYTLLETKNDAGETESIYTYTPAEIKGFTYDEEASTVSGTIAGTGLTLNVYYTRNSYNLKLAVDGEVYETIPYEFGATVAAPAQPSKPGHTFDGWDAEVPATMPSNDVTLNATWTKNSITVTWILEDAESGSSSFTTTNDYGEELTAYELPEIAFYKTFSGWYTDPGYTTPAVFPTTYSANTAYFAKTTLKTYTSTFLADTDDDGEYEFSKTVGTVYGQEITPPTAPDMVGYSFDIWVGDYFDIFEDGGAILELEEDVEGLEFVAYYYPNEYEVIFNLDGGNIGGDTANIVNTVEFDSVIEAPANPSKTGCTFSHWELDGVRVEFTEEAPVLKTEGAEFIAIYTVNTFTVTFVDYDGAELKSETVEYGKAATAPTAPDNKEGYHFTGWDVAFDNITADTTVTAQYTINTYAVKFVDWDGTELKSETVDYGKAATAPTDPTRIGYSFTGWDVAFDNITADTTVTAQYEINTFTVKFVDWDGTELKSETVDYGKAATAPADPTRTGYGFTGWDVAFDNITADTTVTAQYAINTYTVTFVDYDGATLKTETVNHGAAATAPADPTRTGYGFTGWDVAFDNITADTTVTAQYEINTYNVTLTDSEAVDFSGAATVTHGDSYVATYTLAEGYSSIGALTVLVGGTPVTDYVLDEENKTITINNVTGNVVVSASSTIDSFTVTFVDHDGTVLKTETVNYGGAATAPADPGRTGYTFTGWDVAFNNITADTTVTAQYDINVYDITIEDPEGIEIKDVKDEDGDGDVEYGEDIVIDFEFEEGYDDIEDVTVIVGGEVRDDVIVDVENGTITVPDADGDIEIIVTPKLAEYTVTFVDYDGSVIKTETVKHGGAATAPSDPTREGYKFTVWDVAYNNITADTTVTAQYDINSYDALFYADGKLYATVPTEFGKVPVAPADPSKTGYTFTGWSPALAEMTTAGAIYTAVFTADTYNATFDLKGGNIDGDTSVVIVPTEFDKVPVAPADPSKTGYIFGGWDPALNAMDTVGGETYTAKWIADAVTVTIKTYTMDTTGQYGSAATTTTAAEAGESFTYAPTLEKGLHVNEEMSTLTAVVDPEGTTVLTVYVVREKFALITDVDGTIKSTDYYYGATVSVADPENKTGYTFDGWDVEVPDTMPANDVTLKATWKPNTYTITFDTADGTAIAPITQAYGTDITAPANPTRTGYSFTGWDTEIPKTMPAGDMTITALWKADEHLATYKVDGAVYEEYTVEYGNPIPVPAVPTKDGYHFVRWSRTDTVMGTTDLVFNAIFELNEYTVTFVDYDGAVLKTETVKHGGAATAPAAPDNKANYHFTNWDVAFDNITADTTVTAVYAIDTFTVKFVDWNGTELKSETVDYGAAATAPAAPTRTGYTFAAWDVAFDNITADTTVTATYTLNTYDIDINDPEGIEIKDVKDEDGDGNIEHGEDVFIDFDFEEGYDDVADIVVKVDGEVRDDIVLDVENGVIIVPDVDGDIEIIVTPKLAEYTVTFVDYDGAVLKTETVAHGSAATAPAEPDNKTNYHFANWDVAFDNITADTTVTAVYAIDTFTVKFVDWNGTELKSETVEYGAAATAPAAPTRTGYTFDAWDVAYDNITADTTVTATYTVNQYTYTFVVDGTTVASGTIDYGTAIPVPEDPEKSGFEFVYWAPSVPETMPAEDVTFNAVWTDGTNTPYTINIYVMGIDGTYGEPVTTALEGTTNSYVATKAGTITGYTADLEKSVLGGYITADGSLALKIYYARNTYTVTWIVDGVETVDEYLFGEAIIAPEAPEKDGATFLGWDATVPKAMPAENLEFTATWDDNSYTVTWIVDGEEDVDNYLYGATIVKPADPAKTGYTFTGWDAEIPATMPAENLVFTAQFEINKYTVTFLDFDGNVFETYEAEYGANVTVPATEPAKEHYTFEGWNDVPATVPAEDIVIYPNFERITVKLVAREGSTAVIDRNGYIENAEDYAGVAGTDYEAWTEGATGWFIYGLETMLTKTELLENYIKVQGDGRIVVTATATGYGTGAVVEVYDNVTNTVVETFRIVIFGDLNGDSAVKSTDTQIMSEEVAYTTNWSRGAGAVDYLVKAADLSQDGRVEGTDRTLLVDVVLYAASIDQATGEVTYY